MLLILFSLIKWNIFKIAPALTFHIIYVISHQTLHMKASPQWVWKEFPLLKKKKKKICFSFHAIIIPLDMSTCNFCFAGCGFRE